MTGSGQEHRTVTSTRRENLEKCLSIGVAVLWLLRTLPPAGEDAQASALRTREAHSPQVSLSHVHMAS